MFSTVRRISDTFCVALIPLLGVLEYYNANLENIMQYGELRTDVFQVFREIGNIIIICLMIEQELVSINYLPSSIIP